MIWLSRKRVFGLRRENMHGPLERTGTKISRVVNDLTHKEKHKDLHRPRNINQGQNQDFIANDDKVFQKSLEWIILFISITMYGKTDLYVGTAAYSELPIIAVVVLLHVRSVIKPITSIGLITYTFSGCKGTAPPPFP